MSRPLRAVLVDDERLARVELRRLLAAHDGVEVVGEAASAAAARELLARLRDDDTPADLLFLDVQMPGESGFELLERLEVVPPSVVFVTAYDAHALRAFEVSAVDYLVKPVAPARLAAALAKLPPPPTAPPAIRLGPDDRVFVKDGERVHFVRLGDVRLFESEGNYVRLYVGPHRPLVLRTLNGLEERLDPAVFFRANRTHLVNLVRVVQLVDEGGGQLRAELDAGETVRLSRRQSRLFRERMSL